MNKSKEVNKGILSMRFFIEYGLLILAYLIGFLLNSYNNFFSSLVLIIAGISYYFYYSLVDKPSFLKFKAIFSIVWLSTIGLAQLRFLEYQTIWAAFTWVNVGVAHICFIIANDLANRNFHHFENKFNFNKINNRNLKFKYEAKQERYFWVATAATLIGVISFIINVKIKGYIPLFVIATDPNAYLNFYTRIHTFVVASTVTGGLSYYCIKKCKLSIIKKIILGIYIAVLVFIIPILLVQRGTFITAALILTAAIYLSSNRKFWVLLLCVVAMLGVYQVGSSLRGFSDAQLNAIFKPKQITTDIGKSTKPNGENINSQNQTNNNGNIVNSNNQNGNVTNPTDNTTKATNGLNSKVTFKLPSKASFLYSYLTVSHDNFNSVVEKKTSNTWGILELKPFNVLLRSKWIESKLAVPEAYLAQDQVLPYLNTFNLISLAFYDFGIIGVIVFSFLWSFCFGLVEAFYNKYKGAFSCIAYGVCLTPITLCFFDPWMSNFTPWLLWGTVFIMFLTASFTLNKVEV